MGQAGQRVGLIHELTQLAGPEELLDGGNDGPDVDQALRGDGLRILRRHSLPDHTLETGQTDADLILDQLTDRAHPPVGEVVDVVNPVPSGAHPQVHEIAEWSRACRRGSAARAR